MHDPPSSSSIGMALDYLRRLAGGGGSDRLIEMDNAGQTLLRYLPGGGFDSVLKTDFYYDLNSTPLGRLSTVQLYQPLWVTIYLGVLCLLVTFVALLAILAWLACCLVKKDLSQVGKSLMNGALGGRGKERRRQRQRRHSAPQGGGIGFKIPPARQASAYRNEDAARGGYVYDIPNPNANPNPNPNPNLAGRIPRKQTRSRPRQQECRLDADVDGKRKATA